MPPSESEAPAVGLGYPHQPLRAPACSSAHSLTLPGGQASRASWRGRAAVPHIASHSGHPLCPLQDVTSLPFLPLPLEVKSPEPSWRAELAHMAGDTLPAPVKCSWGPAASSDSFPLTPGRPLACYWATRQHPEMHRQNLTGQQGWPHHYSIPARRAIANLAHAGNARIQGGKSCVRGPRNRDRVWVQVSQDAYSNSHLCMGKGC